MADFVIRISDELGHISERLGSAASEEELRGRLREQGLIVLGLKPRGLVLGGKLALPTLGRLKLAKFVQFNQQLLTLLRAGLPVLAGLDLLSRQQKEPYFRTLLCNVRDRVKGGELLSEAFEHQEVIPKLYTTTLLAGEKSGNLEDVLKHYVHFQRLSMSFRKKLKASLIYPTLLVAMVSIMLTFLVTFVVPRFADLYDQLGADLPSVTQFMLAVGVGVQQYAPWICGAVVLVGLSLWRWTQSDQGALYLDRLRLATPVLGPIWVKYQVSTFSRMVATLLSGGLPLVQALKTAGASIQSRELAGAVRKAAERVNEGQSLSRSLAEWPVFPTLAAEMIEVGESTGALPQMLNSAAEFYEEDIETALAAALSLIEPAILLIMAIVVGSVLVALYLPIFRLGANGIR
jgi:type IV pilus assembly protein PilC